MLLIALSFLLTALAQEEQQVFYCDGRFYDLYCYQCNAAYNTCLECSYKYAPEDTTGLCHSYSETFQSDGKPAYYNNAYYNQTSGKVQMLDPFCVLNTNDDGNLCQSCAGFTESLRSERYLSEDARECHATCAYSAQPRYVGGRQCLSCPAGCFQCTDTTFCQECSYTKKRMSGDVTAQNFADKFLNGQIDVSADCQEDRGDSFSKDYYVTPADSHATYLTDLNEVFYDIYSWVGNYKSATINIYLLKNGDDLVHYLLDNNDDGTPGFNSGNAFDLWNGNPYFARLSDRTQTEIKISPRYCSDDTTPIEGCLAAGEKPIIKWKSEVTHIFVTKKTTVSNIIFDGADMLLSLVNPDTDEGTEAKACRDNKEECCTGPSYSEYGCTPSDIKYDDWSLSRFQENTGLNRKYGIFAFQYITDAPSLVIPELIIENCEIKNFLYSKYHTSFVEFDIYGGKLTIKNSSFDRFFFPHGLISNSHAVVDRNYDPMTSSFTQITCRKIDPTYQGDCYSILLEDSTFTNYNPLKTTIETEEYKNRIEGSVLTLHNFDGPIAVHKCTFQNMLSFSPLGPIDSPLGVCDDFNFEGSTGFSSYNQSSHNIITTSKYKMFFDKHFRKYYQAPDTQNLPTTAVLHLRNVTKGLVVHNNTFDQIHSVAGGSVFIHGFNNTYNRPIVISNNEFTNNFAQLFTLNILIYKERQDIASMNCTGILLTNNEFSNNYGCHHTLGNVAIACEATITSAANSYSASRSDTYYTGYSSDVNQNFEQDYSSSKVFDKYMTNITLALDNPVMYTHPYNTFIEFDRNFVEISHNLVTKNYAILSNGFYIETVINLLVRDNTIKQNSIVTSNTYSNSDFETNVLAIRDITPRIRPTDSNIMVESSPLVIRFSNQIIISKNIFEENSQGFWGGDHHIAQAISLSHIIGQADVTIEDCEFNNHQGLPSGDTDAVIKGFYSTAQTSMITFGYWTSLAVYSSVRTNNFIVKGNTYSGNHFGHDPYADTKLIYYKENHEIGGSYEYPFAYLLKFFFQDEETALNITNTAGGSVSTYSPTSSYGYFTNLSVIVQDNHVLDNTFEGSICAFNNFFFMSMSISGAEFINSVLPESESSPSGLICVLESSLYSTWNYLPQVVLTNLEFTNTQGQELVVKSFYYTQPEIVLDIDYFRVKVDGMTSTGNKAPVLAPIYITNSRYVSIAGLTAQSYETNYGVAYLNGSTGVLFTGASVFDTRANITGLMQIIACSNVGVQVDAYNNTLNDTNIMPESQPELATDQTYYRSLVNIERTDAVVFNLSNFYNGNTPVIFKITSSTRLLVQQSKFHDYHIDTALGWAVVSSTLTFDRCEFDTINFSDSALGGIGALDTSTFGLSNSQVTGLSGAGDLLLSANLSTANFEHITVKDCLATSLEATNQPAPSGLITTKLGGLTMTDVSLISNNAYCQTMIYALLMSSFKITDCNFDSNAAQDHKVFDLKKLMTQATFTRCTFSDNGVSQVDVDDETTAYEITVTSNFINVFDTNLYIDGCKFLGGLSTNGAINLLAETKTAVIKNSEFHNNVGLVGSIGGLGSLNIASTLFYGNIHTIVMTAGTNATFTQVEFQDERSVSIVLQNFEKVVINQTTFDGLPDDTKMNDTVQYYPGVHYARGATIQSSKQVNVVSCRFLNMKFGSDSCGGGLEIYNPQATVALQSNVSVQSSVFINTTANDGGAICIRDYDKNLLKAEVVDIEVNGCNAARYGGGIFYHSFDNGELITDYLRIKGTSKIIARAGSGGGALYYESKRPLVDDTVGLEGKTGLYGPIWGSYPVKVLVIDNPDPKLWEHLKEVQTYVDTTPARMLGMSANPSTDGGRILGIDGPLHLSSGSISDPPPVLGLFDVDNQIVQTWNQGTIKLSFTDSTVIKETSTTFQADKGYFIMYPLRLLYTPGQGVAATLTSSIKITSGGQSKEIPINIATQALFRNCTRGERLTDSRECIPCSAGQYINTPDSKGTCQMCPQNLNCTGGDYIGPVKGYWRFDGWKTKAVQCVNPSACLGNFRNEKANPSVTCKEEKNSTFCVTGFCEEGYEGNLCSSCVAGFAKSGNSCVACNGNPVVYIVLVIVVIVAIFFIVFTVRNALKVKEASKVNRPKTSILIKIFLNYVQLVSIVGSFQFQWPDQIKTMFVIQDKVASGPSEAFSLDCLLPGQTASTRTFFMKLLLITISPLFLIIVGTIVWSIIFLARKVRFDKKAFKVNITTTFVVILFMLHATLVQYSILAFRCQNIGDDEDGKQELYLERDLEVKCWDNLHLSWVFACALPAFLIWGIGTPIFAYFLLRRNLKKLENIEFKSKYGFLYDGYQKKKYYWEFVILYRKILMIFISVFMVTVGIKIQALCVLGVCFLSYLLQIYGTPFEDQNLNDMERRSLINATVTLYCGIYYVTGEMPAVADWILLVVILALNVYFFVVWFKCLVQEFLKERRAAKAQSERDKLAKREKVKQIKEGDEVKHLAIGSPTSAIGSPSAAMESPSSTVLKIPARRIPKAKLNFLHALSDKIRKRNKD